jgi:predicted dehydrogenase
MIKLGIIGQPLTIISHLPITGKLSDVQWTGYFSENSNGSQAYFPSIREFSTAEQLISNSDALIIAGNKGEYFNLAVMALKHARHVFFPVTLLQTVSEANKLIKLASEANVILKVFRSGSYNPELLKDHILAGEIWLLELQHNTQVINGNTGKNLFYNLLYNLDFILGLTRSNVVSIKATGLNMLSTHADIISTRVDFDNGCSATVNCNCASVKDEHIGTIVLKDKTIRIDFIRHEAVVWNITRSEQHGDTINTHKLSFHQRDPLAENLLSFIALLNDIDHSLANPEDGFRSFIMASKIMDRVNKTTAHPA